MKKLLIALAIGLPAAALAADGTSSGDTALVLVSAGLVMLMTPGLAFFYGGLVRSKNVVHTMNLSIAVMGVAGVLWALLTYSLAFSPGGPLDRVVGGLSWLALRGVGDAPDATLAATIPHSAFMLFQCMFAVITPALISGALVERVRMKAYLLFIALWCVVVYAPVAHWVWAPGGWLRNLGALDFAGGTVVHINAAVAGLVGAFMIGKRVGYGKESMAPHNLPLTMVGASLLWVGWFGFNAGSALEAGNSAVLAFMNTFIATAAAVLAWSLGEAMLRGKASMLGAASGAVAGLVAITPAAGNVGLMGAIVLGFIAGFACLWGVNGLKKMLGADDTLDVFGVHGVGGIVGALLTGVFNNQALGGPGLVSDWVTATVTSNGIWDQFVIQAKGVGLTIVWSGVVAAISYKIVDLVIGLRVTEEEEREGLDITSHGETAYSK